MGLFKKIININDDFLNCRKIITICGVRIKLKSEMLKRKKEIKELNCQIKDLDCLIEELNYKIKELTTNSLKYEDLPNTAELFTLRAKSSWDKITVPKMKNIKETVDELVSTNKSLIRIGDGEYNLLEGRNAIFQKQNKIIVEKLREILMVEDENLMVGILQLFYEYPLNLRIETKKYVSNWLPKWHNTVMKYNNPNKVYYSAHLALCRPVFQDYDFEMHYSKLKQIWESKEIVIITGDRVFNNIEYNIFDNAGKVEYIYGPTIDAFDSYDLIKEKIMGVSKDKILIFAMGPCGKLLAYEMYKLGYRVLDLGHLIKDYDFYNKSLKMSEEDFVAARSVFFSAD